MDRALAEGALFFGFPAERVVGRGVAEEVKLAFALFGEDADFVRLVGLEVERFDVEGIPGTDERGDCLVFEPPSERESRGFELQDGQAFRNDVRKE